MALYDTTTTRTMRVRRHRRIRARVTGTKERPRLSVFRSNTSLHLQLIDDVAGKTLCAVSAKDLAAASGVAPEGAKQQSKRVAIAYALGALLAKKAIAAGVSSVVFDRSGYAYHGRVKAAADGARSGGLVF